MSAYVPSVEFSEECFSPLATKAIEPASSKAGAIPSLSDDQNAAYERICAWMRKPRADTLTLGGYAGTGKSTLVSHLASDFHNKRIAFCALTGKASNVLRQKMRALGLSSPNHQVMTLHSLLYQCFQLPDGRLRWKVKQPDTFGSFDRIVIDEASMVPDKMLEQLKAFNVPILAVGDHGQLAPVGGSGSLMKAPELRLEKIHRQAEGNPILALSAAVRSSGELPKSAPTGERGQVAYVAKHQLKELLEKVYAERAVKDVAALTWRNETRVATNRLSRRILGFSAPDVERDMPRPSDQVVVLKNAYRMAFNGMRGELEQVHELGAEQGGEHYVDVTVRFDEEKLQFDGTASKLFFGRPKMPETLEELEAQGMFTEEWEELGLLLDFGYALTVHKSQGSQFDTVVVVREKPPFASAEQYRRWMYTAATRAQNRLFVLV